MYNRTRNTSDQMEESPYNNIPDFSNHVEESRYNNVPHHGEQKKESPYGKMPKLNASPLGNSASANGANVHEARAQHPPATVKRPLPPLPSKVDPLPLGGKEHIITDKTVMNDPNRRKEQHASPVRTQDYFIGRIVSQKDSGGLILTSTMSPGDEKANTLIHLPKSAVDELKKSPGFHQAMNNSMTYGTQGGTLGITHNDGKWSYSGDGLPANAKKMK